MSTSSSKRAVERRRRELVQMGLEAEVTAGQRDEAIHERDELRARLERSEADLLAKIVKLEAEARWLHGQAERAEVYGKTLEGQLAKERSDVRTTKALLDDAMADGVRLQQQIDRLAVEDREAAPLRRRIAALKEENTALRTEFHKIKKVVLAQSQAHIPPKLINEVIKQDLHRHALRQMSQRTEAASLVTAPVDGEVE
jgi:regulator of replication initiation timing